MAKQITGDQFQAEVLDSKDTVLVDFFATWCGPCQAMIPVLEELTPELQAGKKIIKIDIDQAPEIAAKYGVMSIPTFKVFKGGEIVKEALGMQSKEALVEMMS
jgi:thioredoxin 1